MPNRPNLFLVGAMKAGTTSLASYLDQHEQIDFCFPKEPNFFGAAVENRRPLPPSAEEYFRLFEKHRGRYSAEASVQYLYSERAPAEIAEHNPHSRILALLRNPIDRAYSHHQHNAKSFEHRPFEQAVEDELSGVGTDRLVIDWGYVEMGRYARQLERYLRAFGERAVHVMVTEQMDRAADEVCRVAFRFLGVDAGVPLDTKQRLNPSGTMRYPWVRRKVLRNPVVRAVGRAVLSPPVRSRLVLRLDGMLVDKKRTPPLSDALRARLAELLAHDVARLRALTGLSLSEWRDW